MPQNVWLVLKICRSKTGDGEGYLIMPPWMVPLWGSWVTLYRSSINSCLWDWAETRPAYLVTSGQSWEATTCRAKQCFFFQQICWLMQTRTATEHWVWDCWTYCRNGRAAVFTRMGMGDISAEYDRWLVSKQRDAPWHCISQDSVPSPDLRKQKAVCVRVGTEEMHKTQQEIEHQPWRLSSEQGLPGSVCSF
jgi:hypothetical protein